MCSDKVRVIRVIRNETRWTVPEEFSVYHDALETDALPLGRLSLSMRLHCSNVVPGPSAFVHVDGLEDGLPGFGHMRLMGLGPAKRLERGAR
jgi:hypothetical protein